MPKRASGAARRRRKAYNHAGMNAADAHNPGLPSSGRREPEPRPKRRYHVHSTLLMYALVTLLIAIGAFNSQNNLLFWLFGLSLGLLVVSGVLSGTMMMGVRIRREAIPDATAGGPLRVRYVVSNRNRLIPAFALTISEIIDEPPARQGRRTRATGRDAGQPPRAGLDDEPVGFAAHVPARGSVIVDGLALAQSRGRVVARGVRVSTTFPFGIIRKSVEVDAHGGCIVRAMPEALPARLLRDARGVAMGATPQPRRAGQGDEFLSLRPYAEGDSPRMIAWKRSARTDDLLVRQTAAPAPRRTWVVLDLSGAPTSAQRERAISLAAGAVRLADELGRAVGLLVPAMDIAAPARSGGWHVASLLNDLALIPAGEGDAGLRSAAGLPTLSRAEAGAAIVVTARRLPDAGRDPGDGVRVGLGAALEAAA